MIFLSGLTRRSVFHVVLSRSTFLFFLVLLLLTLTSCATTKPKSTIISSAPKSEVESDSAIMILKPLLKFERIHDEAIVPTSDYDGNAIKTKIVTIAKDAIVSRNIALSDFQDQNENKVKIHYELNASIPKLSRGTVNNNDRIFLESIARIDPHVLMLVSYMKVKVGSGGTWNPSGGAITSSNSKTVLQAALIQCATGKVLWKDQVLLREVPQLTDSRFSEALELLFFKFPQKES